MLVGDAVLDTLAQRDRLSSCAVAGVTVASAEGCHGLSDTPQKNNNPVN
jgi:hypothetical protein